MQLRRTLRGNQGGVERAALTVDAIFETLSNHRRRYAVHYLLYAEEPVALRDLSEQLAAWELGRARERVTPKERKRLYTALHQTHLPKMDRLGVVDYESSRGEVRLTAETALLEPYFHVGAPARPGHGLFAVLGGLGAALLLVAALGTVFASASSQVYAVAGAMLLGAFAAHRLVWRRRSSTGGATCPPPAEVAARDSVERDS